MVSREKVLADLQEAADLLDTAISEVRDIFTEGQLAGALMIVDKVTADLEAMGFDYEDEDEFVDDVEVEDDYGIEDEEDEAALTFYH